MSALANVLVGLGPVTVAVSGGVDSLTLATAVHRAGLRAVMAHAVSPAVPAAATARVRQMAAAQGWRLELLDAGEFADPAYRANPVDRCFHCKAHLYAALGKIAATFGGTVLSGTNTDDLGDYRPGLRAAALNGVRHPFVEAGLDKAAVRALAREMGLGAVAELPAAPCLSSRIETGLRVEPDALAAIDAVETALRDRLSPRTVRCRIRAGRVEIELDAATLDRLDRLDDGARNALSGEIRALLPDRLAALPLGFAPYRTGSAFLRAAS